MPTSPPAGPARCPRCRGRVHQERDSYGSYLSCLMCGYTRELTSDAVIELTAASDDDPDRADAPAPDGT